MYPGEVLGGICMDSVIDCCHIPEDTYRMGMLGCGGRCWVVVGIDMVLLVAQWEQVIHPFDCEHFEVKGQGQK